MSIVNTRQDEIVEEFSVFDDWMDKYAYIIDLGKDLNSLDESKKNDQIIINGCQSKVWLLSELDGENVNFYADSDAIITKGIVALLIRVLSGLSTKEIMEAELYFIDKIGLRENLSPTRSNGLTAMIKQMKMYALAYNTKINS